MSSACKQGDDLVVVATGAANLASVAAAFARLGVTPRISSSADDVEAAPLVVLPGVGAFGPAMERLRAGKLDRVLRERIEQERPLLAICLGMQLLCQASEESPGAEGLGVIAGTVQRLAPVESSAVFRVPQMGWNHIASAGPGQLLEPACVYFANSFCLRRVPEGWHAAMGEYGGSFVAAIERGPVLACQFHPELSGAAGARLLSKWLAVGREAVASC